MDEVRQVITGEYAIYNDDCMDIMSNFDEGSVHMSIYSPPFVGLYNYSSDDRDLSNCRDYQGFFDHYNFIVQEIARITMSGRITCVHCTDIPSGNSGTDYLIDFPGDIIRAHEKQGFHFIARHTIWKEPLWVRNRTMTKNLSHKTICDDGAKGGVASADYILVFRKAGANPIPVEHPTGMTHYAGECPMPGDILRFKGWDGDQKQNRFSHWIWRRYASSIWDDVRMGRVLPYKDCKDPEDEKHVHPLQLDVIDRAISLRTNPGEIVFTPFMGVGSEVYAAVALDRIGVGAELKPSYFRQSVANMSECKSGVYETENREQMEIFE